MTDRAKRFEDALDYLILVCTRGDDSATEREVLEILEAQCEALRGRINQR